MERQPSIRSDPPSVRAEPDYALFQSGIDEAKRGFWHVLRFGNTHAVTTAGLVVVGGLVRSSSDGLVGLLGIAGAIVLSGVWAEYLHYRSEKSKVARRKTQPRDARGSPEAARDAPREHWGGHHD